MACCLGDSLEAQLGLNPLSTDSDENGSSDDLDDLNGNGTPDGEDDFDSDALLNCDEVNVHETNPIDPDTDNDRSNDGDEIMDGTDPLDSDSDNDGFSDGEEKEFASNPLDENSLPVDPNVIIGEVVGPIFSVLNQTNPTGELFGETFALPFSVENQIDPTGEMVGEAVSPIVSIENGFGLR